MPSSCNRPNGRALAEPSGFRGRTIVFLTHYKNLSVPDMLAANHAVWSRRTSMTRDAARHDIGGGQAPTRPAPTNHVALFVALTMLLTAACAPSTPQASRQDGS